MALKQIVASPLALFMGLLLPAPWRQTLWLGDPAQHGGEDGGRTDLLLLFCLVIKKHGGK